MIDRSIFDSFDDAEEMRSSDIPGTDDLGANPGGDHVDGSAARAETQPNTGRHAPNAAGPTSRGMVYHGELIQGSDEWLAARCGLLTASEMKKVITPTLKVAGDEKVRTHMWELLAQRLTRFVEPQYVSDAMLRGQEDEIYARAAYAEHYAPVAEIGFITNSKWGFTIGYSPDGLVGDEGLIECKSRAAKYQVQTIAENEMPSEYMIQLQTGMLVSERKWCDFISYSAGLPVFVKHIEADPLIQGAIVAAAQHFELKLAEKENAYRTHLAAMKIIETERRPDMEIIL